MKTKTKNIFKSALSLTLALIMVLGVAPISGFVPIVNAESTDTKSVDFDILSAQYISGYRSIPNATGSSANDIFEYYVADDVHSPSRDFLNACYENEALMTEIAMWDLYTSGASLSSAFGQVLDQDDYCELLLLQAIDMTLKEGNLQKILKNDALNDSKKIASALCKSCKVATVADLIESVDVKLDNVYATEKLTEVVSKYYGVGTTSKVCQGIGDIVDYSKDIVEAYEKIVMYNTMVNLDQYTKEWLLQMYNNCDGTKQIPMKTALKNLIAASDGTSGAILASVQNTTETLANWAISEAIDESVKVLASGNVIVAAIFAGLSAGKLVSNLLFATDDTFEQLYTMEQLVQLEELAKKCAKDAKQTFLSKQDKENALYFDRATELYFIIITDVDIDCMKKLVNTLWSGGFGSQAILKLLCGATSDDYNELIEIYDSLKETRKENYQYMKAYCNAGLKVEYPEVFDALFTGSDSNIDESIYNNYYFGKCGSNVSWRLDKSTGLLEVSGVGNMCDNTNWGGHKDLIKSVKIENGVTSIGKEAFKGCTNMVSVSIPDSVIKVGTMAFYNTGYYHNSSNWIESVLYIDNHLIEAKKSIVGEYIVRNGTICVADYAFNSCSEITYVIMPDGVKSVGECSFSNCQSLTKIILPDSVTHVGNKAFEGCPNVKEILTGNGVKLLDDFYIEEKKLSLRKLVIGDEVTTPIHFNMFEGFDSLTDVVIGDKVPYIEDWAFEGCKNLTNVEIGNGVSSIGDCAFMDCSKLVNFKIGNNLKLIGENAFAYCLRLDMMIPDSTTSIGKGAFIATGISNLTIGNNVIDIGSEAFYDCYQLVNVTISESVTNIGDYAFGNCIGLEKITVASNNKEYLSDDGVLFNKDKTMLIQYPNGNIRTNYSIPIGVTKISNGAFDNCLHLETITIPDGVTEIGDNAFRSCGIVDVAMPNSVTKIGSYAFAWCYNLENLKISDGAITIGDSAFYACDSLTDVEIPNSVSDIGREAFGNCDKLKTINIDSDNAVYSSVNGVLLNKEGTKLIQYPSGNLQSEYIVPYEVEIIEARSFYDCDGLTSIIISNNMTNIGSYAFYHCDSLTDVYYSGTAKEWEAITIASNNDPLLKATIHYDWIEPCVHTIKTVIVTPTCTEDGAEYQICEVCDEKIGESKVLPALGHDFGEWTVKTAATCKSEGEEIHTCMRDGCNYSETRKIEKLSTHELKTIRVEPTCTEDGEEYHLCELCEERIGETVVLPATGHSWSEWTVKIPATFEAEGTSERICSICQEKETEIIPKLEPIPV
ncbi:MAG: leucine-rich repeat protein, partial [Monoglobaceae bacterium]